jgi:hypothetical protein
MSDPEAGKAKKKYEKFIIGKIHIQKNLEKEKINGQKWPKK